MKEYIKLQNGISWKNEYLVQEILNNNKNLDVMFEDGVLFQMSIDNGSSDILKIFLKYFENTQYPIKDQVYKGAKEKLTGILESAIDGIELSKEMKEVLAPYIDFEDSIDERLNDSFLNEITIPFENETLNRATEEEINLAGNSDPVIHHNSEVISH